MRCPIDLAQRRSEDEAEMVYISLLSQQPSKNVHPIIQQKTLSQKYEKYLQYNIIFKLLTDF